jgi:hypothetical protein
LLDARSGITRVVQVLGYTRDRARGIANGAEARVGVLEEAVAAPVELRVDHRARRVRHLHVGAVRLLSHDVRIGFGDVQTRVADIDDRDDLERIASRAAAGHGTLAHRCKGDWCVPRRDRVGTVDVGADCDLRRARGVVEELTARVAGVVHRTIQIPGDRDVRERTRGRDRLRRERRFDAEGSEGEQRNAQKKSDCERALVGTARTT